MITEAMLPIIIVPLTFLFVLLIILIVKTPKAGACVVGGLVLLAPLLLWRLAATDALRQEEAVPLVVVPVTFLFVLMIILLSKAPKVGIGLIMALVAVGVLSLFLIGTHRSSYAPASEEYPVPQTARVAVSQQWTGDSATSEAVVQEFDRVFESHVQGPPIAPEPPALAPVSPNSSMPVVASPIWADGIEEEFKADVYPSKRAAARAAGAQLGRSIRQIIPDVNSPPRVVIFQGGHEYQLIAELRDAVRQTAPHVSCDIETEIRTAGSGELGVTLYDNPDVRWTPGSESGKTIIPSGQLDVNLAGRTGKVHIPVRFTEKPWVDNFATFMNLQPDEHLVVARSMGTCMSANEAEQQALDDARAQLTQALGKRTKWRIRELGKPTITTADVRDGGFIVDRFVQSLEGSAGRIWRQALLVDVSPPKLIKLAEQKLREHRQVKMTWARMGFSVIGVTVLIGAIYFFLNMATRGYYEWSLRIAGIVLAIVAVISVLMVVR